MNTKKNILLQYCRFWLTNRVTSLILTASVLAASLLGFAPQASAILAQGDAITDPRAILQYSLPIENKSVRKLQKSLEDISNQLRGKRWKNIGKDLKNANSVLGYNRDKLLASIPEDRQSQAEAIIDRLSFGIEEIREDVDAKDRQATYEKRRELLDLVGDLEQLMVVGYPFEIPEEYSNLPQLLGRATVAMETNKGDLTVVIDGYSAPVNGGNFVDLVQRGFYDGLEFNRAEDFYILQAGDPPGDAEGFIDPKTNEYRAIPIEVLVKGDEQPVYGDTLEELGRYLDVPAIPFNAYGAMALARPANDPNGGSSQFFFFKFDTEITPPGYNLMDGRYSVFGYLIEGKEILEELTAGDKIISAKIIDGIENLKQPS